VLHRVRVDLQLGSEIPHCRQRFSRLQHSNRDTPLNLVDDLSENRPRVRAVQGD
jgi:hypothetical protein